MYTTGLILSFFVGIATFIPFLKRSEWYVRAFDFPRLQILFVSGLSILFLLISEERSWDLYIPLGLNFICSVLQLFFILPYTPFLKKEVRNAEEYDENNSLSLLICNVNMHNKKNPSCLEKACEADPDLLFFVETDKWWENHLNDLEKDYPYTVKHPQDNTYGMLLYSRYELADSQVKFLVKNTVPSIHTKLVLPGGKIIELRMLHPEPPAPGEALTSKHRDAELIMIGKEVKELRAPVIVGGDLNDVAWSHTTRLFQRVSRLLDPRKGRGLYSTFHAGYPLFRWPLDHIFFSSHFSLVSLQKLGYTGSDHFPVFIKLHLDGIGEENAAPPRQQGDSKEADDKIKEGLQKRD